MTNVTRVIESLDELGSAGLAAVTLAVLETLPKRVGGDTVVHPELTTALRSILAFGVVKDGPLVGASRSTAWRWVRLAQSAAETLGALPVGKQIGTHTLRHSYARHLLANGIPINRLSRWLGHANLQTTFIYLEVLPDPLGDIHRVPYWETITAFVEVNGVYPEIVAANVGKRNRV